MARELRLSDIVLPEKASSTKKLQRLAVNAAQTSGDILADKVLLYGLMDDQLWCERVGALPDARTQVSKGHVGHLRGPFRHGSRCRRGGAGFEVCPFCAQTPPG